MKIKKLWYILVPISWLLVYPLWMEGAKHIISESTLSTIWWAMTMIFGTFGLIIGAVSIATSLND